MKKSLKIIIIVFGVLVLAIVGGAVGTYVGNRFFASKEAKPEVATTAKRTGDEVTVPLDEFIINLAKEKNGETPYIKVQISVLTNNPKNEALITNNIALIRDSIINTLRKMKADDILNEDAGVKNLKENLKAEINEDYGTELVSEVYITNLVIQ